MASAKLLPMVVAALLCVVMAASTAWAHAVPHKHHLNHGAKITFYKKVIEHDRQQIRKANTVFRFFEKHDRLLANAQTKSTAWQEIAKWRHVKREHQAQMKFAEHRLHILQPPAPQFGHLALWRCIAGYPGARSTGDTGESGGNTSASNGSHFNILQMTNPWYGINPIGKSAEAIMAKAEAEYMKPVNHNTDWLRGQWGQTIAPCWGYA